MNTIPAQIVLTLVQMRQNLRGTIKTGEQALLAIDTILEALRPNCKRCLFEYGVVANVDAKKVIEMAATCSGELNRKFLRSA